MRVRVTWDLSELDRRLMTFADSRLPDSCVPPFPITHALAEEFVHEAVAEAMAHAVSAFREYYASPQYHEAPFWFRREAEATAVLLNATIAVLVMEGEPAEQADPPEEADIPPDELSL